MSVDNQIRFVLDRALAGVRTQLEADFRAYAQELARVAAEDRNRAVAQATAAAVAEVRQKAHAQLAQIREAAEKHANELRRSADAQINDLTRAIEDVRSGAHADVEDARRVAQAQVDDVQRIMEQRVSVLQDQLADGERRLAEAGDRLARTMREADEARRVAAAEAEELIVAQLAAAAAEHDRKLAEAVERARVASRHADQEQTGRLLDAIGRLDDARSLREVLEVLAQGAAREAERVAVLIARGDHLTGWSLMGFGEHAVNPRAIDLTLEAAGMAGSVITSGAAAAHSAGDAADRVILPSFARDEARRDALALPVIVGGAAVAVLYADVAVGDRERGGARWPVILDVLTRHAGKVLEALTVQQAAGFSLPRPMARASHNAVVGLSHDRSVQ